MAQDLQRKLNDDWQTFTVAEQKIAAYLLQNMTGLPFETAASLAKHVGVSGVTVGRFLHKLGYNGVAEIKVELRHDRGWLRLYRNPAPSVDESIDAGGLEAEMRALSATRALVRDPAWQPVVKLLTSADRVLVAGFQLGSFLGVSFAALLQHVRPHVTFASGLDGAYADVLVDTTAKDCVVLIEKRRYSRYFRILAEAVAARGIPLVLITDTQCYWARQLTPHVLMVPVNEDRAWHSFGEFACLFSMLVGAVIEAGGHAVYDRIESITELRQRFVGFSGPAIRGNGERGSADRRGGSGTTPRKNSRPVPGKGH